MTGETVNVRHRRFIAQGTAMIGIESGRDIIIIWMSICLGAIAMYFIENLPLIIIVTSLYCAITGILVYRKMGR